MTPLQIADQLFQTPDYEGIQGDIKLKLCGSSIPELIRGDSTMHRLKNDPLGGNHEGGDDALIRHLSEVQKL